MSHFVQELQGINIEVTKMSALVEQQVQEAIKALFNSNVALARRVIEDDRLVDDAENYIIENTIRILATHKPVAGDLRFLSSVFRLATDLERVADLAVNLAWRTVAINEEISLKTEFSPLLPEMSQLSQDMLKKALDALVKRDENSALFVCKSDNELDRLHRLHRRQERCCR